MSDYTPAQFAARLRSFATGGGLQRAVVKAAEEGAVTIAGVSVGQFMQNASWTRRPDGQGGPLGIVSGTLARAVRAPDGRDGGISSVSATSTATGLSVALEKGVSLSVVPYARIHELGAGARSSARTRRTMGAIPARPYLRTAAEASRSKIADRAGFLIRKAFRSEVAG